MLLLSAIVLLESSPQLCTFLKTFCLAKKLWNKQTWNNSFKPPGRENANYRIVNAIVIYATLSAFAMSMGTISLRFCSWFQKYLHLQKPYRLRKKDFAYYYTTHRVCCLFCDFLPALRALISESPVTTLTNGQRGSGRIIKKDLDDRAFLGLIKKKVRWRPRLVAPSLATPWYSAMNLIPV